LRRVPGGRGEEGVVLAEFVVGIIIIVVFVDLLVTMGQLFYAKGQVTDAARNAAQAAVVAATPSMASSTGTDAADATLAPVACKPLEVAVNTSRFAPGGSVAVKVSCTVPLSYASLVGIPGSVNLNAAVAAPMESYRNGSG
jgi:Flp pilus assembly protein TadG